MSKVLKHNEIIATPELNPKGSVFVSALPTVLALGGAGLLTLWRVNAGGAGFISDGALMMLALACYLTAAVFHLTDLYAPAPLFQRLGLWGVTAGVFFNLAS